METLALLAAALATGLVAFTVMDIFFSEERRVQRRIATLDSYAMGALANAQPLAAPFAQRVLRPAASRLASAIGSVTPKDYINRLHDRVLAAGRPGRIDPERLLVFKLASAVVAFALVVVFTRVTGVDIAAGLFFAAFAALAISYLPDLYLRMAAETRQKQIVRELPDMLDMLSISVEAGLGFDQAVAKYVQYSSGPLGVEFGIALMEVQAGKSRREALRTMADRAGVAELRTFVMAIVQADVFGVSVSEVLHTQSREMRLRRRQRADELAQKAPAKMVFPIILCILPATLIVAMGPAIIGIMSLF